MFDFFQGLAFSLNNILPEEKKSKQYFFCKNLLSGTQVVLSVCLTKMDRIFVQIYRKLPLKKILDSSR